jgi:hypothetical protein
VTVKDQMGQVVLTQESVHFSASRCQATLTVAFDEPTLLRFVDPGDPLSVTLEACAVASTTCTFANGVLDSKPVVFQNQALDSLLPDVVELQAQALDAEVAARRAADPAVLIRLLPGRTCVVAAPHHQVELHVCLGALGTEDDEPEKGTGQQLLHGNPPVVLARPRAGERVPR